MTTVSGRRRVPPPTILAMILLVILLMRQADYDHAFMRALHSTLRRSL